MFGIKINHMACVALAAMGCWYAQGHTQDLLYPDMFALGDVQLLDGPLKERQDLNVETLLAYDTDKLIAPFYEEAGMKPKASKFSNWAGLDGHVLGHYLSALAMQYAATGDELIKERLEYVLGELKTIQDYNSRDNNFKGYLSGVPNGKQMWLKFKNGNAGAQNGYWVPWYNIHKTFAGLRDAYIYGGYEQAKTMFLALCDWGLTITGGLNDNAMESMLGTEHGGMDEVYADAYALTKNEKYLKEAKRWSHKWLLNAMAAGNDNLTNIHANTQVPKVVGFARIAELTNDATYVKGSEFFWDRVVNIIENNDYEGCKEEFIHIFAMEVPFTQEQFINDRRDELEERTFQQVMEAFNRKTERIQNVAWPIIQQVYENQGAFYERIMVPLTDGRRMYNIPCNLKEAYDSHCKTIVKEFEKMILLHIIDECWKENLRELDELKHSVQNASYEQKDPLLIFKLESVKLFDNMVNNMNNRIVSILMRSGIPEMQQAPQEAPAEMPKEKPHYVESKQQVQEERLVDPNQQAAAAQDTRAREAQRREPIVKSKMPGRNDPCPCGSGKKFKNCHGRGLV